VSDPVQSIQLTARRAQPFSDILRAIRAAYSPDKADRLVDWFSDKVAAADANENWTKVPK
jgi:hypothetical protein